MSVRQSKFNRPTAVKGPETEPEVAQGETFLEMERDVERWG